MAPTGASKDERMASFITLLGEMLYVDDTVMIAPIDINDDDDKHFIKTKMDIPSNFTKLGKHIMISGGSWVFTKKEKGNNDVYGRCWKICFVIFSIEYLYYPFSGISSTDQFLSLARIVSQCSGYARFELQVDNIPHWEKDTIYG